MTTQPHLGPCRPDPTTGVCAFPWHVHAITDPSLAGDRNMANPDAAPGVTAPNIDRLLGVDGLREWWIGVATRDIDDSIGKIAEYGGTGSAQDLLEVGHLLAKVAGRAVGDEEATELGIFFYVRSKIARWGAAIIDGRRPSDDTLYDLVYYGMMARRTRFAGGWPVANRPHTLADMPPHIGDDSPALASPNTDNPTQTEPDHPHTLTDQRDDLLYDAWQLIANTGWDAHRGTLDSGFSPGWHEAALRWRDRWHNYLAATTHTADQAMAAGADNAPIPEDDEGKSRPFYFTPEHDGTLPLETAVYQALGAASVCWDRLEGAGTFRSDRAKEIGDKLLQVIGAAAGGGQTVDITIDPAAQPDGCPIHRPRKEGGYTQTGWACTTPNCPVPQATVPLSQLGDAMAAAVRRSTQPDPTDLY